jgi:hypothetical protein
MSFFSLTPDQRIQRETPGDTGGAAPPPGAAPPAQPDFDAWIAQPINAEFTKKIRTEAATNRVKAKAAEELLGTLPKALEEAKVEARAQKLRASLSETFHNKGVSPGSARLARLALIDGGQMTRLTKALDAEDFDQQLEDSIDELMEEMPELRGAGSSAARITSAPMTPTSHSSQDQLTLEEIQGMPAEAVESARRSGRLNRLLGRV